MKFAIFENTLSNNNESLLFHDLEATVNAYNDIELINLYNQLTNYSNDGLYAIGYFSYNISINTESHKPLASFQIYKSLLKCNHNELINTLNQLSINHALNNDISLDNIECEIDYDDYQHMFTEVFNNLLLGNSYQINLTNRFKFDLQNIDSFSLYYKLSRSNPVKYTSYIQFDNLDIISISPELFFQKDNNLIITRPMKGTINSGINSAEKEENKKILLNDEKNRAENLIIVDLMRNDLAKIAKTGTVKVNKLFDIEEYNTVLQMTSEIQSKIEPSIQLKDIISALFPCGSITGAPKKKTIELIDEIEKSSRDVYTGNIGYILPNNDMMFNVAIRTITKYHDEEFAQFGAGGGITIQSNSLDEWQEIKTKTKFITNLYKPRFSIVESMLFKNNNIQNIEKHLTRLKNTADHLLFECNFEQINNRVLQYVKDEKLSDTCKLRLELDYQHNLLIEHSTIAKAKQPIRIGLLKHKINTSHFMFKYKTTSPLTRGLYTELHNKYTNDEVDEIIFVNQNNQITESRFFNVIIEYQGKLITPPTHCGLLPGIFRQTMIDNNELVEEVITQDMLKSATKIYLCNDVRGLIECAFIGEIG